MISNTIVEVIEFSVDVTDAAYNSLARISIMKFEKETAACFAFSYLFR